MIVKVLTTLGVVGALLTPITPAQAANPPTIVSSSVTPVNLVVRDITTQHVTVTVILDQPANDLTALVMEPSGESSSTYFNNDAGDGVTWVRDWTYDSRNPYGWGTFSYTAWKVTYYDDPENYDGYHSDVDITGPAITHSIKGLTQAWISKSRTIRRGQSASVHGNLAQIENLKFETGWYEYQDVTLQGHRAGQAWRSIRTIRPMVSSTDFILRVRLKHTTYYRWVYKGDDAHMPSTSRAMKVRVR